MRSSGLILPWMMLPFMTEDVGHGFETEDKKMKLTCAGEEAGIDKRSEHATLISGPTPADLWQCSAGMVEDDFSLAGFQKFCK